MSTGKRLAKRSILGTRVCAPLQDGLYYPGVIDAMRTIGYDDNIYTVSFADGNKETHEYRGNQLVGPGFCGVASIVLRKGQRVYVTLNGREVCGVVEDIENNDHVHIAVPQSAPVVKRRDEVRLLESRKSARLQDFDTDYSRLAESGIDGRRRAGSFGNDTQFLISSRKRRPSTSEEASSMGDCMAAMVLMSLSGSPHSFSSDSAYAGGTSWDGTPSSLSSTISQTPPSSDRGVPFYTSSIYDDSTIRKKAHRGYRCTWPGCSFQSIDNAEIEDHVRGQHLSEEDGECDLEFYYTDITDDFDEDEGISDTEERSESPESELRLEQLGMPASAAPTLSHLDMARPAHEDPEYCHRQRLGSAPINIPIPHASWQEAPRQHYLMDSASPPKHMRLSQHRTNRRGRSESRKCRKMFGMEKRDQWCTQCRWKKACSRFPDSKQSSSLN